MMAPPPKPTVPEVLPIVRALYAKTGAGCCWHVVLDDYNVADDFVIDTVENTIPYRIAMGDCEAPEECQKLAELLPKMSKTQRRKLASSHYGRSAP